MPYPVLPAPPIPYFQNNPRLVDLMVRQGDSRAAAIRQQGQDSAQLWNTVGQGIQNTVGNAIQAKQQEKDNAAQQKLRDVQLKAATDADAKRQSELQANQAIDGLMKSSLVTDPVTGLQVYDRNKMQSGFADLNIGHLWPQYSELVDKSDSSLKSLKESHKNAILDVAKLVDGTGNNPTVFLNELDRGVANKLFTEAEVAPYRAAAKADGSAVSKITGTLLNKKPELMTVNPGDTVIDKGDPGKGALYTAPEKITPTSLQSENVLYQGKPVQVTFDPHSGKRMMVDGAGQSVDVTGKTSPLPRASSQGLNSATDGGLSPDAVDYVATQYRILGPSGMPTRLDENQKIKVLNASAKQVKSLGQTPAVAVQRQAAFKSDGASLTKMTTMKSSAEAFETKANAQAGLVGDLSSKVGRTQFPIVNDVLLTGKERIGGDENTHLFSNALLTFTTEYAKIMEGSTGSAAGSSEGARKDAARLISTGLNNGTIQKTIAQMQWEMRQTIQGYDVTIEHITERMGGTPQPANAPTAPRIVYDMNGNVVK